jgi:putative protease
MSPRDLCTLPFVEKLLEAGISSLKIEGRNRSPEYAATVVRAYREVVDAWNNRQSSPDSAREFAALKEQHMNSMKQVFNRGFSQGFFMGQPIDAWTKSGGSLATHRKLYVGFVTNYYARPGVAEVLVQDNPLTTGDQIIFTGNKTGIVEQTAESMQVEHCPIETVERGSMAAIKVKKPVRRNDKLYKLVKLPTEQSQS